MSLCHGLKVRDVSFTDLKLLNMASDARTRKQRPAIFHKVSCAFQCYTSDNETCASLNEFTGLYIDKTKRHVGMSDPSGGCQMRWGIRTTAPDDSWLKNVQVSVYTYSHSNTYTYKHINLLIQKHLK